MEDLTRLPPQSLEAEDSVVGAGFLDSDAVQIAAQIVRPEQFWNQGRALLYRAQIDLTSRGEPVDDTTMVAELARKGVLDRAGGLEAMRECVASVPSAANVAYYARIVRDKARLRDVGFAGRFVFDEAFSSHDRADVVLKRIASRLREVGAVEVPDGTGDGSSLTGDGVASPGSGAFPVVPVGAIDIKAEPPWLVKGLIPAGSCVMLAGDPKTGKSWFAGDVCTAVATGTKFLGREVVPLEDGASILCVPAEDPLMSWAERIDGLALTRGYERSMLRINAVDTPAINLVHDSQRLLKTIQQTNAKVVVLDPFSLLHDGDENVASDVLLPLQKLRAISRETGCTIIVIHHMRKPSGGGVQGRRAHRIRGSSASHGWADLVLLLELDEKAGNTRVDVEARTFCKPKPFAVRLDFTTDTNGRKRYWHDLEPLDDDKEADEIDVIKTKIIDLLRVSGMHLKRDHIVKQIGLKRAKVLAAIRDLLHDKKLDENSSGIRVVPGFPS